MSLPFNCFYAAVPSIEEAPKETQMMVAGVMGWATGFLQAKDSKVDAEAMVELMTQSATENALETACKEWEESRRPCTAKRFVQLYVQHLWNGVLRWTGVPEAHGRHPRPLVFIEDLDESPLLPEFLWAIHLTEEEVVENTRLEEHRSQEETSSKLQPLSTDAKASAGRVEITNTAPEEPITTVQRVKAKQLSDNDTSTLGKRKNHLSEAPAQKRLRGSDGQKMSSGSSTTNATQVQWSGVLLTASEQQLMNDGLMNAIWNHRVSERLKSDPDAGVFEVRILKDSAWLLLGKDIEMVFALIGLWGPIRLHTFESGSYLHVGLWIRKDETQGLKGNVIHYRLVEMFRLLRQWSLQAQVSEKPQCLADFLEVWCH